jgi:hypothetical protein
MKAVKALKRSKLFKEHNERVLIDKLFEKCQINIKNTSEEGEFFVHVDISHLEYENDNTAKKVAQNVINKLIKDGYKAEKITNFALKISWDNVEEKKGFKFPFLDKFLEY